MFNEILFAISIAVTLFFSYAALFLGQEFLTATVIIFGTLANFFVIKEISLFGKAVSCTDVFFVGMVLCINFLEEFFGRKSSSRTITAYTMSMIIFLIFKSIHLSFIPTAFDTTQNHFAIILGASNRIILSSIIVSFITLNLDRILYRFLSNFLDIKFIFLKNFITGSVSQLIDTILFSYLAVSQYFSNMHDLISFSYMVKIIVLVAMMPVLAFTQKLIVYFNIESLLKNKKIDSTDTINPESINNHFDK